MLSPSQLERLSAAAKSACLCEQATGLPAEITVAQWAIESSWGAKSPGNNCFGIKAYPGCRVQSFPTQEVIGDVRKALTLEFAAFDNLQACFEKHARLITCGAPYAHAWATYTASKDVISLINEVAPVYATDPDYANRLRAVMSMHEVQCALKLARA
ncbi:MAG: glucosaminidase domain-containing protein [Terracidiphilus sp.]|nr:glucosaminidase domain-containing protein [Terracidiphilus sp.]